MLSSTPHFLYNFNQFLVYWFLLYFLIFLLPCDRSVLFETFKERKSSKSNSDLTIQIIENFYMEHLCFWARGGANTSTKSATGGKPFWWELRERLQSGEEKRKKCRQWLALPASPADIDSHQPCRHRQLNEHSPTSPARNPPALPASPAGPASPARSFIAFKLSFGLKSISQK